MELFDGEIINISKIHTVAMFESSIENPDKIKHYSANLPTYELIFFISGEGITRFNGAEIKDCENSLRYLPKGAQNKEYTVQKYSDGVCIDIYFDTPDVMPSSALGFKSIPELKYLFEKIYNIWSSKKSGYYINCMMVLYEIIKTIKKHNKKYISPMQSDKINRAYEYMLENYNDKNFDCRKLCNVSGLSYSYFKELFISKFGMPPVKYLTKLRIEKAKELIITHRYSITEISDMCGFENVYYFSNLFKKYTGVSPSKYTLNI